MRLSLFLVSILLVGVLSPHRESHGSSVVQNRSGTFRGVIVDIKGERIRGASVVVEGDLKREVKPNRAGYFEIDLPDGMYEITVKKSGFVTYKLTDLKMKSRGEFSHVFRLTSSRVQCEHP